MKVGIQFNGYDGTGRRLQTTYRVGCVKLDSEKKNGSVRCLKIHGLPEIDVKFNLGKYTINDCNMSVSGVNIDGYGRVDMVMDIDGSCMDLAQEAEVIARLVQIHSNTPGYYKEEYGYISDVKKHARELMQKVI